VADFFNAPSVDQVDLSGYSGAAGDVIHIRANDDFDVATVAVDLRKGSATLESSAFGSRNKHNPMTSSLIQAPPRYRNLPGHPDIVYDSICKVLSERGNLVEWDAFTEAEWGLLPRIAQAEGVGPLLYWHFKNSNWPPGIPTDVTAVVRGQYYNTLAHNTLLFQELERILTAFEQAAIPVILLKGAALAHTAYENIGLRPMGDLDLLVEENRLGAAEKLVQGLGYVPEASAPEFRPGIRKLIVYESNFRGGEQVDCIVELHWNLIGGEGSRYQPDIAWFWKNSVYQELATGVTTQVLNPTANLLYCAAHQFYKHMALKQTSDKQSRVSWLYDIRILLKQGMQPDKPAEILAVAERFNWAQALKVQLDQAYLHFGVPDKFKWLTDQTTRDDRYWQNRLLFDSSDTLKNLNSLTWPARFQLVFAFIFPTGEYLSRVYPPGERKKAVLYLQYWSDLIRKAFTRTLP